MVKTFIIAEAGINHKGDLSIAKALVEVAKEAGADAVKFQTYKTENRTFIGSPIWDILKQCELSYDQQAQLKTHADNIGIEFFSTPSDEDSLKFLVEDLGLRRIKISSFDVPNTKFLDAINEYAGRLYDYKLILSTGMSNINEIEKAIKHLYSVSYLTILHCRSSYPLVEENQINLAAVRTLQLHFHSGSRTFGFSDHSPSGDLEISPLAVMAGATTIERHITLDYGNGAVDNPVSLNAQDFKSMVGKIRRYESILGENFISPAECENEAMVFRRQS